MSSQLPKIAIVGVPNVGKSTLFNRLIGRKQAIVDDIPGVTRDRQYGVTDWEGRYFTVIDTGGFVPETEHDSLEKNVKEQALLAVEEADLVCFVVDGRFGRTPAEEALARILRKQTKPVILAVNKIDSIDQERLLGEFYKLGFPNTIPVSAEMSRGVSDLLDKVLEILPVEAGNAEEKSDLKLAILGRPNVGKSTLLNALIGEERAVVHHKAGTTRDPLNIRLERGTRTIEIVDTAGIRRKSQSEGKLEKVSVLKALKTAEKSNLVLVVVDAKEGVTAQDAKVLGYAQERGRGMLLVLNKWDLVPAGTTIKDYKKSIVDKYKRLDYVPIIAVSAKHQRGMKNLFELIDQVYENFQRRVGTGELNRVFQKALKDQPVPTDGGHSVQIYYATQSGWSPPTFVLFSNRPKLVKESYLRYLERVFRKSFEFDGAPLRWVLRKK
ncbi:MAG: ribosome biogenesis GTPase Der [Deltaproteobacteria bacterium]|nr:ribosome biogenesis GTPase Der [Deltaproteobacteria bacterium]